MIDEIDHSLNDHPGELSSSDLVDKVYRRIVESHSKPYGWQVCLCFCFCLFLWQVLYLKFMEFNTLTSVLYIVSHCLQPADRWGMKLVRTPCGNSVWVTGGEAEKAVETEGMDAVNASRWSSKVAPP